MENQVEKKEKLRVLCLHGFRTSGKILEQLVRKWPESVLEKLDLVFLDAPFPALGKSDVEGIFDPPYFEWFRSDEGFKEFINFEECIAYLEDYMIKHGPFDGLLGFSQGAILAASLPGIQLHGEGLTKVPKIKLLIIISGAKFGGKKFGMPKLATNAFSSPIECPSIHLIGESDLMKQEGIALLDSFVDPIVIHHPKGHTIPILDEKAIEMMLGFIDNVRAAVVREGTGNMGCIALQKYRNPSCSTNRNGNSSTISILASACLQKSKL